MKYSAHQIARELNATALGQAFYGNALRVAKDIQGLTDEDRAVLESYATGKQKGSDHILLQEVAMKIKGGEAA